MALNPEQIRLLTRVVADTKEHETDCDDFLSHLVHWSEQVQQGRTLDEAQEFVQHHLSICNECNEEFRLLTEVLKDGLDEQDETG